MRFRASHSDSHVERQVPSAKLPRRGREKERKKGAADGDAGSTPRYRRCVHNCGARKFRKGTTTAVGSSTRPKAGFLQFVAATRVDAIYVRQRYHLCTRNFGGVRSCDRCSNTFTVPCVSLPAVAHFFWAGAFRDGWSTVLRLVPPLQLIYGALECEVQRGSAAAGILCTSQTIAMEILLLWSCVGGSVDEDDTVAVSAFCTPGTVGVKELANFVEICGNDVFAQRLLKSRA